MGRKQKVSANEVEDILRANGLTTVSKIASELKVTEPTIRNKLRELRKDGLNIMPTHQGVILIEKIDKDDEETANLILKSGKWQISIFKGMANIAAISKKPLAAAGRVKELSTDERKELKNALYILMRIVDMIEVDNLFLSE